VGDKLAIRLSEVLFVDETESSGMSLKKYCTGLCGEFAVALSEVFGYELASIMKIGYDSDYDEETLDFLHAFCLHPSKEDLGIDALGVRPISEMKLEALAGVKLISSFGNSGGSVMLRVVGITMRELDELSMEGLDSESLVGAKEFIIKHRSKYEAV
jgi:hypothetical protein